MFYSARVSRVIAAQTKKSYLGKTFLFVLALIRYVAVSKHLGN